MKIDIWEYFWREGSGGQGTLPKCSILKEIPIVLCNHALFEISLSLKTFKCIQLHVFGERGALKHDYDLHYGGIVS